MLSHLKKNNKHLRNDDRFGFNPCDRFGFNPCASDLPDDTLFSIMLFLNHRSITTLGLTNKKHRELSLQENIWRGLWQNNITRRMIIDDELNSNGTINTETLNTLRERTMSLNWEDFNNSFLLPRRNDRALYRLKSDNKQLENILTFSLAMIFRSIRRALRRREHYDPWIRTETVAMSRLEFDLLFDRLDPFKPQNRIYGADKHRIKRVANPRQFQRYQVSCKGISGSIRDIYSYCTIYHLLL